MSEPQDDSFAPHQRSRRQPLDNPDELFDLVDLDDQVIGQVRRGDAHRNPALIHRSVQILVFASDGRLLLQRRSAAKDLYPGYYCASASGHVASGEEYANTAKREMAEELGIAAPLRSIGKTLIRSEPETEMTMLYVAQSDGPYHFHPTETTGGDLFEVAALYDSAGRAINDIIPMTPALHIALVELMQQVEQAGGSLARFLAAHGQSGGYGV